MIYILLKNESNGGVRRYYPVISSSDINVIKSRINSLVRGGYPAHQLKIVQDVPFELKLAVVMVKEDSDESNQ